MDLSQEQWEPLADATSIGSRGQAPRSVLMALAGLLRGREPRAICASVNAEELRTVWQVAAVADRHVIVVEASRNVGGWALGYDGELEGGADKLTAWAAPISTLTSVEVRQLHDRTLREYSPADWSFAAAYRFHFRDNAFTVPLRGSSRSSAQTKRVDAFVAALLNPAD